MYHDTTAVKEQLRLSYRRKIASKEERFVYLQFLDNPRGWTSDELYHAVNRKLEGRFDKVLESFLVNDDRPLAEKLKAIKIEIAREFDRQNGRKTRIKRCLSDLSRKALIYRSEEKRTATTGFDCYVYKLKTQ